MNHSIYTIGLLLQEKRIHLGLSIPDVSKSIKIRPKYIIAIEQGETASITIPAYIIGYIRIYAHFLELNGEAIIAQMKEAGITLEMRLIFMSLNIIMKNPILAFLSLSVPLSCFFLPMVAGIIRDRLNIPVARK